ncbi:uncharacterized protein LOC128639163 [Bombina bombina]|uniref:uncharacterized protein LOC128639163 n=1 Tax=Bombina bombina TaxID=8345 RepID=UPI00235AC10E|nr:uncharacterized protein LOC128639163 [Bombina bombina]
MRSPTGDESHDAHHQDSKSHRQTGSDCCISHYKNTYTTPADVHPRSSKRPLRTPLPPKLPPMNLVTTQRTEFIPRLLESRTKPFIPNEEFYQSPQEPLMDQTLYSLHFPPKDAERLVSTRPPDTLCPAPPCNPLLSTTNKADYRVWRGERQAQYGELPTQIASILFPGGKCEMKTTTQQHFVANKVRRVEPAKTAQSSLVMEGDHSMITTHQAVFQPHPLQKVSGTREPVPRKIPPKRPQMNVISKYKSDFTIPLQPQERTRATIPPTDNLTVNPHYRNDFQTVQRENFPGWDPRMYPRPELTQLKEELTSIERERGGRVDGITMTKLSFKPPAYLPQEPVRRPHSVLRQLNAKFDATTHSHAVFQDWGVQPFQRHGDVCEGHFLKPLAKLESQTTSGSTFVPKIGEMVRSCKPAKDNLELTGERYFSTLNRDTYRAPVHLSQKPERA